MVLSNVNRSSVSVFITTTNSRVAEASTWKIKYFSETSELYIFLTLDISGINYIRLINCLLYTNIWTNNY